MTNFLVTLMVATVFSLIALKMKVPAGALLGAIVGVILLNTFTQIAYFPQNIKIVSTSLVGTYIGCHVLPKDLQLIRDNIKSALIMVLVMLIYNLISSKILTLTSHIDFCTAFLALAPGGVTDMSLVALDMGANVSTVSTIQMLRLIIVIGITPFIIKYNVVFYRNMGYREGQIIEQSLKENSKLKNENRQPLKFNKIRSIKLFITLVIGLSSGTLGKFIGFPAGNLCFSICAVAALNIFTDKGHMPLSLRRFAQMLSGALIGIRFSLGDLSLIWDSIIPILMIMVGWLILNQVLGFAINRWSRIPLITALLSSSAGGMTDMGIIASEMGFNSTLITYFHFTRLLSVLLFYPIIIQSLVRLGMI